MRRHTGAHEATSTQPDLEHTHTHTHSLTHSLTHQLDRGAGGQVVAQHLPFLFDTETPHCLFARVCACVRHVVRVRASLGRALAFASQLYKGRLPQRDEQDVEGW